MPGGELWVYPLSHGVPARVRISVVGRGLSIDGKRRLKLDFDGGTAGLIIDARGRPLPLATNLKALSVQIPEWYAQVTGDPIYNVPTEWLMPPVVEPDIASVTDRRSAQRDNVYSVLNQSQRAPARRSSGRLFGRRVNQTADAEEGEDDDFPTLLP